jgi:hypothetical protein
VDDLVIQISGELEGAAGRVRVETGVHGGRISVSMALCQELFEVSPTAACPRGHRRPSSRPGAGATAAGVMIVPALRETQPRAVGEI